MPARPASGWAWMAEPVTSSGALIVKLPAVGDVAWWTRCPPYWQPDGRAYGQGQEPGLPTRGRPRGDPRPWQESPPPRRPVLAPSALRSAIVIERRLLHASNMPHPGRPCRRGAAAACGGRRPAGGGGGLRGRRRPAGGGGGRVACA